MNKYTIITKKLLIIGLIINQYSCNAQFKTDTNLRQEKVTQQATIAVQLKPGHRVLFNNNIFTTSIDFKNLSATSDSLLEKKISNAKPVHLNYGISLVTKTGIQIQIANILLFPGDSVLLNSNLKVAYSTGYSNFIDSIIAVPSDIMGTRINSLNDVLLKNVSANRIIGEIKKLYQNNAAKIERTNLDAKRKNMLNNFNLIIRDKLICNLLEGQNVATLEKQISDSLNSALTRDVKYIDAISSLQTDAILYHILLNEAKKKNSAVDNFWDAFLSLDEEQQKASYYEHLAYRNISNLFVYKFDALSDLKNKLLKASPKNSLIDSLTKLTNILLGTYTNYKNAKEQLAQFDSGKYLSWFNDEKKANHETLKINTIPDEFLLDYARNKISFKEQLFKDTAKYKYIFIDFWASWCIPCRQDYPYLKKVESDLKNYPIKFISISLDDDIGKWLAAIKQMGNYGKYDFFILNNEKESNLKKFLNIISIPHYLIIEKNGDIVKRDFAHPQDLDFKLKLIQLLNE